MNDRHRMISKLRISNFKAIEQAELALSPLHLLIGPNDSGKTTIVLQAVSRCGSIADSARTGLRQSDR